MASDRATAEALAQKYRDPSAAARALALAVTHAQSALRHLGISTDEALLFERLASRVLGRDGSLRASPDTLAANELGQAGLWAHGISGDLPILLVRVDGNDGAPLVRQVLQAQEYWRLKGLRADVVILNEHPVGYLRRDAGAARRPSSTTAPGAPGRHRPGGAYLLRSERIGRAEHVLLQTAARAILQSRAGTLRTQLERVPAAGTLQMLLSPTSPPRGETAALPGPRPALTFANGRGGFTDGARAYGIVLDGAEETPMPWANVIANPQFGTIVTASGSAHTWSGNSRENRLTSFANDPVSDPTGEALFIRDDETGESWSPTPGPMAPHRGKRPVRRPPYGRRDAVPRGPRAASRTSWTSSSMPTIPSSTRCSRSPTTGSR